MQNQQHRSAGVSPNITPNITANKIFTSYANSPVKAAHEKLTIN